MNSLTKVDICNLALALVGSAPILSLDAGDKEANAVSRFYDSAREAVLQEAEWSFAITHQALALSGDTNLTDYAYMYGIPADCIKPLLIEEYDQYQFEIRGQYLYSNMQSVVLRYVTNIDDEAKFDPGFTRALAHRLAADLAVYFKDKSAAEYLQKYEFELKKAKGQNLQYQQNRKIKKTPLEYIRFQVRGL